MGYQPVCGDHPFFEGAFFSILCCDEVPFLEPSRLAALSRRRSRVPGGVCGEPVYLDVCEAWDVGEATSIAHRAVSSSIPMLIYVGEYDAYGPLPVAEQAIASLSGAFLVDVPYQDTTCWARRSAIRNAWLEDPTSPPDTSCIEEIAPPSFEAS